MLQNQENFVINRSEGEAVGNGNKKRRIE